MRILILGGGGREHAMAWKLVQSPGVSIFAAPGNPGIAQIGTCCPVADGSPESFLSIADHAGADLTVVGPEAPLVAGVVDAFRARGRKIFGPDQAAARMEGSKVFAKSFLTQRHIPTADFVAVDNETDARRALDRFGFPVVLKADGLAAGKGVIICPSRPIAIEAAHDLFSGKLLGQPEQQIVVEEFLEGDEISYLCLSDGKHVTPLVPAQDHKRIGEGDKGPNTGGMGVYTTDTMLDPGMNDWILRHIAEPTVRGMAEEETPFAGVLYCGLIITARGPQVLEFNARFGDPETQAILLRLESDLVDALEACIDGRLADTELRWTPGASACVVASSAGYPGSYKTGFPITGLSAAARVPGVQVFHAGSAQVGSQLLTNGGRVLGTAAAAPSLEEALARAYQALAEIHFEGIYYRHDIGHRAR